MKFQQLWVTRSNFHLWNLSTNRWKAYIYLKEEKLVKEDEKDIDSLQSFREDPLFLLQNAMAI